jgi:peroxiredoxin
MEALYQRFSHDELAFLAVDMQESRAEVEAYIKEGGYTFPVGLDASGEAGMLYGVQSIPSTLLIDRQGNIIAVAVGAREWDTPEMHAAFEALLAVK